MELNLEALDGFVSSYLREYDAEAPRCPEEGLRHLLLSGAFPAAADRLRQLSPSLADNPWLQFQLKKHHFLHLARSSASASASASAAVQENRAQQLQEALELARRELAPLALHAYCEAYSDFKHCMLALVSGSSPNGGSSSGASADAELREFAGLVVRAVKHDTGFADTALAQLLRYLLLLYQHQQHTGFHPYWWPELSQQAAMLCARLLRSQRDVLPPSGLDPALASGSTMPAGGLREHDVQALRTSLGCDREEAVTLLRRGNGNAFRGLQDALQAAHIDEQLLHELACEYAACRGLQLPAKGQQQQQQQAAAGGGASGEAMQVDQQTQQPKQAQQAQQQSPSKLAGKAVVAPAAADLSGEANAHADAELALPAELSEQQLLQLVRQLDRLLVAGQADKALQQLEAADPSFLPDHPAAAFALHRCHFLQLLPATPSDGTSMAAALAYVRQHLSPLAQQHPSLLQPQLKAVLALLLPLPGASLAVSGAGDTDAAAQALALQKQQQQGVAEALSAMRAALRPRCHVREPRLLCLLRELLGLHAAHFKLQRCQDRFAADLGLPGIKSAPVPAATAASAGAGAGAGRGVSSSPAAAADNLPAGAMSTADRLRAAAAGQAGGGEIPVPGYRLGSELTGDTSDEEGEGMEEGSEDEDEEAGVSEQAILTVCEFTGLPRHTAIELLLVHGGDAAAVLAHVFP